MDEPKAPTGKVPVPRSKRGTKGFFKELSREMKRVTWPTRAETNRLTGVVLGVCVLVGAIMITMSWAFGVIVDLFTKGSL